MTGLKKSSQSYDILKRRYYSKRCSAWEFLVEPFLFGRKSNTFPSFVVTFSDFFPLTQKVFTVTNKNIN